MAGFSTIARYSGKGNLIDTFRIEGLGITGGIFNGIAIQPDQKIIVVSNTGFCVEEFCGKTPGLIY